MSPVLTREAVLATIQELATRELRLQGALPAGDLADALDSVQRLTLVVAIEDHFQISFDPEDEGDARTIDGVVSLVMRKLEGPDVHS